PIGGELSHEFIILAKTGESSIFCDKRFLEFTVPSVSIDFTDRDVLADIVRQWTSLYAATEEMHNEEEWSKVSDSNKLSARGIEVGHIFHFGTKYSAPMGAKVMGQDGKEHFVSMGSYGIGPSRLVAAVIESSHDKHGIIWPKSIAPFDFGIINMKPYDEKCSYICETL
ncbi:MAG: proline--tRNA ligase, partial [Bartonella sp.]|nr:proline--tRNA ligase [Bartonella sp.]